MLLMDSANLDQQEAKEVLWRETVWWDPHEYLIWDTTKEEMGVGKPAYRSYSLHLGDQIPAEVQGGSIYLDSWFRELQSIISA